MNELRAAIADIIDLASRMIDELDDETMLALADLLNAASGRLTEMEQQPEEVVPATTVPQEKTKLERPFPSSNVHSFGYDDKTGRLLVKFQGDYPDQNGPVYGYEGVPKNIFELFRKGSIPARTNGKNDWGSWWKGKVPSLGASLYTLIKGGGYPYQRLT
jgi:hypothetical protein